MSDPTPDVVRPKLRRFQDLMPHRVRRILLVQSLYDSFILTEDGQINRQTGEVLWTQTSSEGFPMVAAGRDSVFVVEGDLEGLYVGADKKRRSGIPVAKSEVKIRAFDVQLGTQNWSKTTTRIPSTIPTPPRTIQVPPRTHWPLPSSRA